MEKLPDFKYERKLWKRGFRCVAGADEVGRGALVGPIVAGAVVFSHSSEFMIPDSIRIDDSKRLTARMREKSSKWIKSNCLAWGIGETSVSSINRFGISKATRMAFRGAIAQCSKRLEVRGEKLDGEVRNRRIEFLLIDAFYVPYTRGLRRKNQLAIVKGDQKSFSIAAASIIAKVYRDKAMRKLGRKYRQYGWIRNKGYGTREHIAAIGKHGVTRMHRKSFVRKFLI